MAEFDLQEYLVQGVEHTVKEANSHGGAEPCPFSPYSDINVKETSLREEELLHH